MVEVTIALPLILLLMLVTAEVGRLLYQYNTLTKAQRAGANYLARNTSEGEIPDHIANPETPGTKANQAANLVVFGQIDPNNPPVTPPLKPVLEGLQLSDVSFSNPAGTDEIVVQVSYAFTPMLLTELPTFYGDPIPLEFPISSSVSVKALN
ncbi:TadE/TadG family type IV pilus assembly protein [Marinobacterium arenosum]|uniref:TadE/TadG family type IV pilus assembly protein n=1 Tax=Marinobacterium arenosum TaxID=2862496 RepID=UPI001C98085A|nr:TadE/TadG family type IV pilus assembly protein [Marinobacterium arenosum]MBY4675737.1 pilus assembly protein [Marinobacterium arenosum]